MKFKSRFLAHYLNEAPVPLAYERAFECEILSRQKFDRPILDVGCGDGIFANILFDEKIDTGLDPLEYELERARKTNQYQELIQAFGDKIPKPDNSYQTVFSNSVLEHIENLDLVLKEMHRVLAPGGSAYLTLPTHYFDQYTVLYKLLRGIGLMTLAGRYQLFFNRFWKHYHYYSRNDWQDKFEKAGFSVSNVIQYGAPKDCLFNDMMVPLTLPNYFVKKLFNRFFLFPPLRRLYSGIWNAMLNNKVKVYDDLNNGGLIFFHLKKSATPIQ